MTDIENLIELMFEVIDLNNNILSNVIYSRYIDKKHSIVKQINQYKDIDIPPDIEEFYYEVTCEYDLTNEKVINMMDKKLIIMNIKRSILEERVNNTLDER